MLLHAKPTASTAQTTKGSMPSSQRRSALAKSSKSRSGTPARSREEESPFQAAQSVSRVDSDNESTVSSGSTKPRSIMKKQPPRNLRKGYETGEIPELGTNVFDFGKQDKYNKSMEAFQTYVGKNISKDMFNLIKYKKKKDLGAEPQPPEAKLPTGVVTRSEDAPTQKVEPTAVEISVWRTKWERWQKKTDEYEEKVQQTFMDLHGQCTVELQQMLHAESDWGDIEQESDVLRLMEAIRKLSCDAKIGNYKPWKDMKAAKGFYLCEQRHNEDQNAFHFRWNSRLKNMEDKNGRIQPSFREEGVSADQAREQFLACLYLENSSPAYKAGAFEDLNNLSLAKGGEWPKTVTEMKEYMSKRAGQGSKQQFRHQSGGRRGASFAQMDHSNKPCYYCHQIGHIRPNCPLLKAKRAGEGETVFSAFME